MLIAIIVLSSVVLVQTAVMCTLLYDIHVDLRRLRRNIEPDNQK